MLFLTLPFLPDIFPHHKTALSLYDILNFRQKAHKGTKRSILTDGKGIPLSVAVDKANRHDKKLVKETLDTIIIKRPSTEREFRISAWIKDMIFLISENWLNDMVILPISKAVEKKT